MRICRSIKLDKERVWETPPLMRGCRMRRRGRGGSGNWEQVSSGGGAEGKHKSGTPKKRKIPGIFLSGDTLRIPGSMIEKKLFIIFARSAADAAHLHFPRRIGEERGIMVCLNGMLIE